MKINKVIKTNESETKWNKSKTIEKIGGTAHKRIHATIHQIHRMKLKSANQAWGIAWNLVILANLVYFRNLFRSEISGPGELVCWNKFRLKCHTSVPLTGGLPGQGVVVEGVKEVKKTFQATRNVQNGAKNSTKNGLHLTGLSHESFRPVFWPVWMHLGLHVNRLWFFNFKEGSSILYSYFKYWCVSYQSFSDIHRISEKDWQLY